MKDYNLCCIGHITLDKIVTPDNEVYMPGGTAYYFAKALAALDPSSFLLVTAVGESELPVVDTLRSEGIKVEVLPSAKSVFFENIYGADSDHRTQRVRDKADPFKIEDLSKINGGIIHLGTLLNDDFSPEVIKYLAGKGRISVDAQGFLRRVEDGSVYPTEWREQKELLPYIDILKANEEEMKILTGSDDPEEAARMLAAEGVKEVVLTLGSRGSVIYTDGELHRIPALPIERVVDATGCGDTYMAGYLWRRSQGASIPDAARFATAMCALKLTKSGPCTATAPEILALTPE